MKNKIFNQSETMSREYCCSIVRVGEVIPVEGSDFLGKTIVDGFQIVVRKDMVHEGDIMFYASNETELNEKFLSVNNQFEEYEKNANYEEVKKLLDMKERISKIATKDSLEEDMVRLNQIDKIDEKLKTMRGFFNKYGRVKMITLRKCPSLGYLFTIDAMANYCPKIRNIDFEKLLSDENADLDFDTVDGELFVKAYMPRTNHKEPSHGGRENKRNKKLNRIDRLVENQFVFHYDTQQLNKNIDRFNPDDIVYISTKIHGTSFICGNLKVKEPKKYTGLFGSLRTYINKKIIPSKYRKYNEVYDDVYSSRTVIKNQYLNENAGNGFYGTDIWGEYQQKLKGHIPEGMTVYGEIFGYLTGSESMIQKNYDYGCSVGENRLMIYRITTEEEDGSKREWEIDEVKDWVENLANEDIYHWKDILTPFPLLYHGTLRNLYPEIEVNEHWHESVLEALKNEKRFLMEKKEPLCKNSVPREGIVIRIANDPVKEAFKLKCSKFLEMEGKLMDSGEVDMEMNMRY